MLAAALLLPACLAAELLARRRLRARARYHVWPPHSRSLTILELEAPPGLQAVVRTEINRDGERGDPPPEDWTRAWRVLVLGDSSAECRFVDQPGTWPAVAQRYLNRRENLRLLGARRAHVGNVGRSSATCRRIATMLDRLLPQHERLDAVVLAVGVADVERGLARGGLEEEAHASELFAEHPEDSFGWTPRALALVRVLSLWRRRCLRPVEIRESDGRGQSAASATSTPDPAPWLERFEESLRDAVSRALTRARTVIVVRPSWLVDPSPDEGAVRRRPDPVARRLLEQVDRRAAKVAREMGVAEVDPKLLLEPGPEHHHDGTSYTPAGCKVLGEAVAQALLRERQGRLASSRPALREERHADVA